MNKENFLNLEQDLAQLSPAQIRLIKSIHAMLLHVSTVDQEEAFFEGSAELMRMVAQAVQQSKFAETRASADIDYAQQAVEFAMDLVNDALLKQKVIAYDN